MSKIKPNTQLSDPSMQDQEYFLVQREDGQLRCSCGGELIKLDEYSYRCSGGYPIFRPDDGDIIQDKFGNKYLRMKPHKDKKNYDNKNAKSQDVIDNAMENQEVREVPVNEYMLKDLKDMEGGRRKDMEDNDDYDEDEEE